MRPRLLSEWPFFVEPQTVGEINIEPAVLIVVKESDSTPFGFDDVFLLLDPSPNVDNVQPCFFCHVDVRNGDAVAQGCIHFCHERACPSAHRANKCLEQGISKNDGRKPKESTSRGAGSS